MLILNKTTNTRVSAAAQRADTFETRLFGLIPRQSLGAEEGLWLEPCAMIHMCFMRFPIDAVFLDKGLKVLRVIENFKPWRFSPWVYGARGVLELPAGRAAGRLTAGDLLEFREQPKTGC